MTCILRRGTVRELGGKAFALAALQRFELPIPPWFAVAPESFARSLTPEQQGALSSGDSGQIRQALASVTPAPEVCEEIQSAVRELGQNDARFAVRSSAVDEDGQENSFAGQLSTYLFVDSESVVSRVGDVWRSGFSERLLEYRRQRGMTPVPTNPPAVLVQRMVNSDVSGVAFSADPVSGRRAIAVVSAVFGLGTALVGGEAAADVFEVDRERRIERRSIVEKNICHRFDPAGEEGVSAASLPREKAAQPALTDEQAIRVAELARRAANAFGQPQDIEWAIEGKELFLLQSRPITTLRSLPDPDGVLNIWDNSNITESYNGVTTPLTFSFARYVYEGVYRQFCRILRVPERKIAANDHTFRHMLGLIRGRVYYNLLNWYRVLALLPGFKLNRRFMEEMMGVRESLPDEIVQQVGQATASERVADAFNLLVMLGALIKNHWTLDSQISKFYERLNLALAEPKPPLGEMRLDELARCYYSLETQLLTHWDAPLVNDFFAMIFHGLLRKLTQKWMGDGDGTLANDAIRGGGGMISAEPAQRVREMAEIASLIPELVGALCESELEDALTIINRYPKFLEAYHSYLEKFGDRCMEELKLESETLHENPVVLLRSIGELAQAPVHPVAKVARPDQEAEARIRSGLRYSPLKRAAVAWTLRHARTRVRNRENLRFERTRLFGRVRRIFLEAGRRLHALGVLEDPRDVFYLEIEEVLAYIDGTGVSVDLRGLAEIRKREFDIYRNTPAPAERFETRGPVSHAQNYVSKPRSRDEAQGEERQGIGCCPGVVKGKVMVVRDPKNARLPAGSILVADHTDPGWIMLFPSASGLLVERGSLLSHSAIVARELGIPAIISIPGVTEWLRDGDTVELDGASGVVRRIPTGEAHA